jgi:hypothetical protein
MGGAGDEPAGQHVGPRSRVGPLHGSVPLERCSVHGRFAREGKTLAVIVIHENRGLTDWVRLFADQVADRCQPTVRQAKPGEGGR